MSAKQKQNLKLTCMITGKSRNTNTAYLDKKAQNAGSVESFVENYVSRSAAKLLRQGMTVDQVRAELEVNPQYSEDNPVTDQRAKDALNINGKRERQKVTAEELVAVPA